MKKWMKIILAILGLPKTIYFNFKSLPIKHAIFLPIILSPKTRIVSSKGKIIIKNKIRTGMITFGLSGFGLAVGAPCVIQNNGIIIFNGKCKMGGGTRITCGGKIIIGEDCIFTGECVICAEEEVSFGRKCLVAWQTQIMDTDYHHVFKNFETKKTNINKSVHIDDHVWICSRALVLKGASISKNSILASMALLNTRIEDSNVVIAGNPAKVVRSGIDWHI